MNRRVVITGMGVVSALGIGIECFWQSIKAGKSGISKIERVDVSDLPTKVGAEIKEFNPEKYFEKKELKRLDRFSQYALAAAQMAAEQACLGDNLNSGRIGVIIGSGIGGIETLENQYDILRTKGVNRISAFFVPMMLPNAASGMIAIKYGAKGFVECVATACASSANAIGDAYKAIQRNAADIMIAGGAEAPITRLALAGFCANKTMTTNPNPATACRPFDAERDGFVAGEGAGVIVLEEYDHAIKRSANIIAEVRGYGCTNDAYHITGSPGSGEGSAACMRLALEDAKLNCMDIDYINAHGTSTKLNDKNETTAIRSVFGDFAEKIPVSSTKSMTGHLLGAAGAIETIVTALALQNSFIPPTINYQYPDCECDLDYVPNEGKERRISYALTNSFGFGGHNASLVLKSFKKL